MERRGHPTLTMGVGHSGRYLLTIVGAPPFRWWPVPRAPAPRDGSPVAGLDVQLG